MAKLTKVESLVAQAFLHDLFEAGGLIKRSIRTYSRNYIVARGLEDQAKEICDEIKQRLFNFPALDASFNRISNYCWFESLHEDGERFKKSVSVTQMANIIAAFCAEQEILWDDVNTHRTTVEMETYGKSYLGAACLKFGCFLSQKAAKKTKASRSSTPRVAGAAPKSGYKSSGPRSGDIKGLIGEPGEKTIFDSSKHIYSILCHSDKPKKQYAFIDPLSYKAEVNKVRLGDPSGYTSCKLFFATLDEAGKAVEIIESGSAIRIPSYITKLEIVKQASDANGYFKVNTEVGPAYIKASKLNEEIMEELSKEPTKAHKSKFPEINDIDVYSEAMHRYE